MLDRHPVFREDRENPARNIRMYGVHEFHRLEDSELLTRVDDVVQLDERRGARFRAPVEGAERGREHEHLSLIRHVGLVRSRPSHRGEVGRRCARDGRNC